MKKHTSQNYSSQFEETINSFKSEVLHSVHDAIKKKMKKYKLKKSKAHGIDQIWFSFEIDELRSLKNQYGNIISSK